MVAKSGVERFQVEGREAARRHGPLHVFGCMLYWAEGTKNESRWLGLLELPRSCLRKHTLNHMPTSRSGRARHARGAAIYGAIQKYAGFDEPAWLD